ncbi:caspase family protein [Pseudactinotalea sp. Z1748]|uniref:caspase family protein n=1 Tax=Pseudactinotalea sp. Z1748 TaxID=3413027 RepID=UPI003C7E6EE6
MNKALIVGIDHYDMIGSLRGAVNDAHAVKAVLERHADGTLNFAQPRMLAGTGPDSRVTRSELRAAVEELFRDDSEIALLYFAGHGYIDGTGGFLCASDCAEGHDGLALADVMSYANNSPAKNKVIILDSCHGGIAGASAHVAQVAEIREGVTILTASTAEQYSMESGGSGVFTTLLVDALNGAAANLVGQVTPGSVYAHIDQSLGAWAQRPVFKTNVKKFVSLRNTDAPIALSDLKKLTTLFAEPTKDLQPQAMWWHDVIRQLNASGTDVVSVGNVTSWNPPGLLIALPRWQQWLVLAQETGLIAQAEAALTTLPQREQLRAGGHRKCHLSLKMSPDVLGYLLLDLTSTRYRR